MRKLFSICLAALMSATMLAAETEFLPISVYAADNTETFPFGAKDMVENKLTQLLTRNGIAGMDYLGQFVLTVTATPLDKDIIPGPPAKIAEKMDLNLYIVDAYARTIFSATSLTVRGLGETENKCYLNAISRMPLQSEQVAKFVQEGKQKILDYYNHEAPALIKRANHLAKQRNYEEALNLVALIPQQCDHFDAALEASQDIYQQYLNYECNTNLAAARSAWAAGQNKEAAEKAGEFLALIMPDAGCYEEAQKLYNEIRNKVLDDWKFQQMQKHQDSVKLEGQRIEAQRQIGVAFGQHQPQQKTTIEFLNTLR